MNKIILKNIPYRICETGIELDRDAMEIQAYRYRVRNLQLQIIRIILSCTSILVAVGIFIFWVIKR